MYNESTASICDNSLNTDYIVNNVEHSVKKIGQNEIIIQMGEKLNYIFFITSGAFRVFSSCPKTGREINYNTLYKNELLGDLSVLTGEGASASVAATIESEIILIKKTTFHHLLENNKTFMWQTLLRLAENSQRLSTKLSESVFTDCFGRICHFIEEGLNKNSILEGLTHYDIAIEVGATRESVTKILSKLSREGYITLSRKRITVTKKLPSSNDDFVNEVTNKKNLYV